MTNIKKLTWLSYLTFTFSGVLFISQGILILYMSKTYNIDIAYIGYFFFIPAVIQAIVTFFNGYILEKVNLKTELFISFILMGISYLCIISGFLPLFIFGLIPMGFAYGIMISVPNYMIITLHPKDKFSKLNILNFFFSVGGILGPFIIGQLLDFNLPWQLVFSLNFIAIACLIYFLKKVDLGKITGDEQVEEDDTDQNIKIKQRWTLSIYLIALAMLLYVLSEVIFSTWIVAYFNINYKFTIFNASLALTVYWLFITFGRFAADKVGKYIKIYQFIITSSMLAFISFIFIFLTKNTTFNFIIIALMGLGYSSLYASIFSYGMDQLDRGCPRTMSFFVLCGTIGNILAMPISSFFVHTFSIIAALIVSLIMIGLVSALIYITLYDKNNKAIANCKRRRWGAITRRTRLIIRRNRYLKAIMQIH